MLTCCVTTFSGGRVGFKSSFGLCIGHVTSTRREKRKEQEQHRQAAPCPEEQNSRLSPPPWPPRPHAAGGRGGDALVPVWACHTALVTGASPCAIFPSHRHSYSRLLVILRISIPFSPISIVPHISRVTIRGRITPDDPLLWKVRNIRLFFFKKLKRNHKNSQKMTITPPGP